MATGRAAPVLCDTSVVLVGACAAEHRLPLLSADDRALSTYAAVGAQVEMIGR